MGKRNVYIEKCKCNVIVNWKEQNVSRFGFTFKLKRFKKTYYYK